MTKSSEELKLLVDAQYDIYQKEMRKYTSLRDRYRKALDRELASQPFGFSDCLESYIGEEDNHLGYERLQTLFKPYEYKGLYFAGGYWTDTNQRILTICIRRNITDDSFNTVKDHIESCLWAIRPSVKGGYRRISIFEHTLSLSTIYSLHEKDGLWCVAETYRDIEPSMDLETVLNKIKNEHWYGDNYYD